MRDPRVRPFGLRVLRIMFLSWSATSRARRFSALVGIPPEVGDGRSREEEARMGRALRRLVLPSQATLERQLGTLRERKLPLSVVTGGWNPAFEAVGDVVAALGGGRRVVIRSEHHFPQLVSEEFNDLLAELAAP